MENYLKYCAEIQTEETMATAGFWSLLVATAANNNASELADDDGAEKKRRASEANGNRRWKNGKEPNLGQAIDAIYNRPSRPKQILMIYQIKGKTFGYPMILILFTLIQNS